MTTPNNYNNFIEARRFEDVKSGFFIDLADTHHTLMDHQKYLVRWACAKGRAAVFADTGLGKSRTMCEWARHVAKYTSGRVIILSPLAVAAQTVIEASRIDMVLEYARKDTGAQFIITNYEMIDAFDMTQFSGIVLDESSILKNFEGSTRRRITEAAERIPYRLSCTATPSPNDYMELGTQAEFLGVMSRSEMLAMFFQHDSNQTSNWVLKGHGRFKFWEWMATWAVFIKSPEDLGLDGSRYVLPELDIQYVEIPTDYPVANTLTERREAKKASLTDRVNYASLLAQSTDEPVIVWCHLNDESAQLTAAIPGAVEVKGADKPDHKINAIKKFLNYTWIDSTGKIQNCRCSKWSGKKNTLIEDVKSTTTTPQNARSVLHSVETQKQTSGICPSTISQTNQNISGHPNNSQKLTDAAENVTQSVSNTEISNVRKLESGNSQTLELEKISGLKFTELQLTNSTQCSNPKTVNAEYADMTTCQTHHSFHLLTTATAPEKSGGYCVPSVTSDYQNSKITQSCSCLQSGTSETARVIVSKPKILGYGLNLQHCNTVIFAGLTDSFEEFYQAIRRCYRFGQTRKVTVYCILSSAETSVVANLMRKEKQHDELSVSLGQYMNAHMQREVVGTFREYDAHDTRLDIILPEFLA